MCSIQPFTLSLNNTDTYVLLGKLVLEELKQIRKEMKENFRNLNKVLKFILDEIPSIDASKKRFVTTLICNLKDSVENVQKVCLAKEKITNKTVNKSENTGIQNGDSTSDGFSDDNIIINQKDENLNEEKKNPKPDISSIFKKNSGIGVSIKTSFNESLTQNKEKILSKQHLCKICGEFKTNIRRHLRTHSGYKPFNCKTCGKSFIDSGKLKKHQVTHTGNKPYHCKICDKRFGLAATLQKHQLAYHLDKPHSCDYCEKKFTRPWLLKNHMHSHTALQPFQCSFCYKSYSRYGSLKQHLRTHDTAGDVTFTCAFCEKRFCNKVDLIRHTRVHTKEKPFTCLICSKSFALQGTLKSHQKVHMKTSSV